MLDRLGQVGERLLRPAAQALGAGEVVEHPASLGRLAVELGQLRDGLRRRRRVAQVSAVRGEARSQPDRRERLAAASPPAASTVVPASFGDRACAWRPGRDEDERAGRRVDAPPPRP